MGLANVTKSTGKAVGLADFVYHLRTSILLLCMCISKYCISNFFCITQVIRTWGQNLLFNYVKRRMGPYSRMT